MPEINVVNETLTREPKIRNVEIKSTEPSQPESSDELAQSVQEPSQSQVVKESAQQEPAGLEAKGEPPPPAYSHILSSFNKPDQEQEIEVSWDEAEQSSPFYALNYDQSKSMADTWLKVYGEVEERLGGSGSRLVPAIQKGNVDWMSYVPASKGDKGIADYGKEAVAGVLEWAPQTFKLVPAAIIWGGALLSKLGVKSIGESWMQFGAEGISAINFSLAEFGMDVDRSGIAYNISQLIPDILVGAGISSRLARTSSKKIKKAIAEEVEYRAKNAKKGGLKITEFMGRMTPTSTAEEIGLNSNKAIGLYNKAIWRDKLARYSPLVYMQLKDVGSMAASRAEQYIDQRKGTIDSEKFLDNFVKESAAVGTYGALGTLIEAMFGLGSILGKGAPKGIEVTLQSLRDYGLRDIPLSKGLKNHLINTFIGLSVFKEGFTEALQESTQSLTEMVYGLETRQADGTLKYEPKTFKGELQRIAWAAIAGGVVGGGMSFAHVHAMRNQYIDTAINHYLEQHPNATQADITRLTNKAKESFNQMYADCASATVEELNAQHSIGTESGEKYRDLTNFIQSKLIILNEQGYKIVDTDPLTVTNLTSQIANVMINVMESKGILLSDFNKHLDLDVRSVNDVLGITATWDGVPIFNSQEHMINPNERNEEESKVQINEELLAKYKQVSAKQVRRRKGLTAEEIASLPTEGKVWIEKETNTIVTDPKVKSDLDIALKNQSIQSEGLPLDYKLMDKASAEVARGARGGFNSTLGTIFVNPAAMDFTTVSHELGHLYAENMYMAYKNGILTPEMQKQFSEFLDQLGIDKSLPHLTTRSSEAIADIFSAVGSNSAIIGQVNKTLKGSKLEKAIQTQTEDFKKHAIQAFKEVNHKGIQITPAVQEYVQQVLGIKPSQINNTITDTSTREAMVNNLPEANEEYTSQGYDPKVVADAIMNDNINQLDGINKTIARDTQLEVLMTTGKAEDIIRVAKENYNPNSEEGCIESLSDNLNNYVAHVVEDEMAITGRPREEVLNDKTLFQRILPESSDTKTGTKSANDILKEMKDTMVKKDYKKLTLLSSATRWRYGSMLFSPGTFTLTVVSNTFNTAMNTISDAITGRFRGVTNLVSKDVHNHAMKLHDDTFHSSGLANSFVGSTTKDVLDKSRRIAQNQAKYEGKGEKAINFLNKIGKWTSDFTTAYPDHLSKTYYGQHIAEMTASKIAMETGLNANNILLDSLRDIPMTREGYMVRAEAQDAMRQVEFIPSGNGKTIGERSVRAANKAFDIALDTLFEGVDPEVKDFVRAWLLPFNGIASGISSRVINGMIGIPYGAFKGIQNAIKTGNIKGFMEGIKSLDRRYLTDTIAAFVMAGALVGLIDPDEDYMPPWELATPAQRNAAKALGIPFDSIRIGGVWISSEYCGLVHTAVRLLPALNAIKEGKIGDAWGKYVDGLHTVLMEAPVIDLISNIDKSISADEISKNFDNYLTSFVPRIGKDLYRVISKEDKAFNPLTGTKEATQPYMQFIFGSRARLFTQEQAEALAVVRKGINIVPRMKDDMTPEQWETYSVYYSDKYNNLMHSGRLKTMSKKDIKNAFASIKRQALKASGYKPPKDEEE